MDVYVASLGITSTVGGLSRVPVATLCLTIRSTWVLLLITVWTATQWAMALADWEVDACSALHHFALEGQAVAHYCKPQLDIYLYTSHTCV